MRVCVVTQNPQRFSKPGDSSAPERAAAAADRVLSALPPTTAIVRYRYRHSPVLVLEVNDRSALAALERAPEVVSIHADLEGSGALVESRELVGANEVNGPLGIRGAGRVVAVLDSGADTDHPDLADAIVHQYHFLGGGANVGPGAEDGHGHGTNVTGIVASRGIVTQPGIAPEADVVAVKVLDDGNRGFLSDWAAGVEYVVDLVETGEFPVVDAINMSLVSDATFTESCDGSFLAFSNACRRAKELGIAVFAASGNLGGNRMTSPACFSAVFSVGSVRDTLPDRISSFTSRTAFLDLLAPGETIVSTGVGGGSSAFNGTSQATPHCAALAALLRSIEPDLDSDGILTLAQATGVPVFCPSLEVTFSRIDVLAATSTLIDAAVDCNENEKSDVLDVLEGISRDCNANLQPDECEIAAGTSQDCNENGVPDECEPDCNGNGVADECDIATGAEPDADGNGVPDRCERLVFHRGDATNDGDVDLSDGIALFNFLFTGGLSPAVPGPPGVPCGVDSDPFGSPADLGCDEYDGC